MANSADRMNVIEQNKIRWAWDSNPGPMNASTAGIPNTIAVQLASANQG